nr:kelch domain-containing protein 4-like [Onthophagus taurus]
MGKKDKNKKKGKGAEKTAVKTEKKMSSKLKKELEAKGEEDIETILAQLEKEEKARLKVTETLVEPPSRRLNFSLVAHPLKEELILFGGEFYNGQKTFLYNDLYFYNILNNTWTILKAPGAPPPRCSHQMVVSSVNKGQLWIFGGEFSSPTQSQFYHYRDLWLFNLSAKTWEKIQAPNGPSARSGHRMVYHKKMIFVFGGFHDNLRDYKYFNDLFCFNTETYSWHKIEAPGSVPNPRSGCCFVPLNDGKLLVYGGYSKEKLKKDVDKGHFYTDSFSLVQDKNDQTGLKWKWTQTKLSGISPSSRCSMPITIAPNGYAYSFGGVFDVEEDEEILRGKFFNDFFSLDLEKNNWRLITLQKRKDKTKLKQESSEAMDEDDKKEDEEEITKKETTTIADDGVFKVTIGPAASTSNTTQMESGKDDDIFVPCPRMNCGLAVKHGILYLYGGMFEDGDRQVTLCDFYSLDLKKLDEWKTIIGDTETQEWMDSDSESDEDESDDEEGDDKSGEEDMETD